MDMHPSTSLHPHPRPPTHCSPLSHTHAHLDNVLHRVGAVGHAIHNVLGDGDGQQLRLLRQEADALRQLLLGGWVWWW
jgi:hypothetical protein